jgi:ATP-dependent exoDNAse (exonuclease V) beta subunit
VIAARYGAARSAPLADGPSRNALAGRIDAIAFEGDHAEVVVDWKSDGDPDETHMRRHARQLEDYLRATGALRGALVYMTPGVFRWVTFGGLGR